MTQKYFTYRADVVRRRPALMMNRRNVLLSLVGLALILGLSLAVTIAVTRPIASGATDTSSASLVPYSNALAMHYAQPWLQPQKRTAAIPYSDALALHYAQPWLVTQKNETEATITYSNALAMLYAQPRMAAERSEMATNVTYSNALAMHYAQPWLTNQSTLSCHSGLDAFYACQNRQ
jgi:hypothetical protein